MAKFTISCRYWSCGDYGYFTPTSAPIDGARKEFYWEKQTKSVPVRQKQEAYIDEKGKAAIRDVDVPVKEPENWNKFGKDHARSDVRGEGNGRHVVFERYVERFRWVIDINSLEEVFDLENKNGVEWDFDRDFPNFAIDGNPKTLGRQQWDDIERW